ncbi:hypothetical protein LWI29_028913 [Acer saccharum]|uniref:Uncharacterized protein n=1 Tax=Acer saccharum TaxID=4024 RepID=A0AA39VYF6_ACESA|nr:hypothetical protein LWI29_028913 [Acer saccharum]
MDKRGIYGDGQLILTGVYDRNQINEFQNSNKKGKGCGKDERLSDKSTYFHLRKDKVNRKVSFSRDVKEKMAKFRAVSSTSSNAGSVSSLVLCSRFGKGESMIQAGRNCRVGSFKWDSGCGHSGKGPVSPNQIPEIGKARRSVDAGEGLEEAYRLKEGEVGKVKKAYWNIKEELAKVIKAGMDLGFDFKGRENDMVEEIISRIKVGSYGKLEGILPFKNN